jgi:O-antigen/teichoic acid export membrane protein
MAPEAQAPVGPAALMVGARIVNMAMGLATLPVLIRFLGGNGFAAWAILLAVASGLSLLEIGMSPAVVRFLTVPILHERWEEGRELFGRAWVLLALSFGMGGLAVYAGSTALAAWLRLPATELFSPQQLIQGVFVAVAMRAFLQNGILALFASRRFGAVAAISVLQPLSSNVAAMVVAWQTGRLDMTLAAFWIAQLLVVATTFVFARKMCVPRFLRSTIDLKRLRELGYYGLVSQMEGWAQFVNFQFDKLIIAGLVGLWGVAPYEVANRAIVALRSVPASGAETVLPSAMANQADREQLWKLYLASTRMAAYGVVLFMLAPLVVAPVFLYAWTGEMGYLGRWIFVALSLGAMASVLALPAATLAQAEGRPGLQGVAALAAIAINIPLSLLLVVRWGSAGAALGTAVAMTASACLLIHAVHRHFGRPVKATVQLLGAFWPPVVVCLCWMVVSYGVFGAWFETLAPATRYSRFTRVAPGFVAMLVYAMALTNVIAVEFWRGAILPRERALLADAIRGRWLARKMPR